MTDRLDSTVVRRIIEIGTSGDPLMLLLVTYLGAAFHASLFGGVRVFMVPHQEKLREMFNGPPSNAHLNKQDLGIVADASKSPCCFIAKEMGDEAMRRFMKGDGDNYWDHPNRRQVEYVRQAAFLRCEQM